MCMLLLTVNNIFNIQSRYLQILFNKVNKIKPVSLFVYTNLISSYKNA